MKITLFGSTGMGGKAVLRKAVERGHEVTVLMRSSPAAGTVHDKVRVVIMFILRHYGRDGQGRTVSVNYFKAKAGAGAGAVNAEASAETTTMHVRSSGPVRERDQDCVSLPDDAGLVVDAFEGEALDPETMAEFKKRLVGDAKFLSEVQGNWDDPVPDFVPHKRLDPTHAWQFEPTGDAWIIPPFKNEQDWDTVHLKGFSDEIGDAGEVEE